MAIVLLDGHHRLRALAELARGSEPGLSTVKMAVRTGDPESGLTAPLRANDERVTYVRALRTEEGVDLLWHDENGDILERWRNY